MNDRPTDIIDVASELSERMLQEHLDAFKARQSALPEISEMDCIDCGDPIPEARRQAVKGCQRCIECQQLVDKIGRR